MDQQSATAQSSHALHHGKPHEAARRLNRRCGPRCTTTSRDTDLGSHTRLVLHGNLGADLVVALAEAFDHLVVGRKFNSLPLDSNMPRHKAMSQMCWSAMRWPSGGARISRRCVVRSRPSRSCMLRLLCSGSLQTLSCGERLLLRLTGARLRVLPASILFADGSAPCSLQDH